MFPDYTATTGNYNELIIKAVAERYRRAYGAGRKPHRRIYISRSRAPVRRVLNDEVVHGESLSFSQQVQLLSECEMVAVPHGAGFVNMLFMPPGGSVLEIHPRDTKINNCYFTLASALSHPYYYMLADTASKHLDAHLDNMIVDPNLLERNLQNICA
jgi:capsular polysaccharide biosynthesis protein